MSGGAPSSAPTSSLEKVARWAGKHPVQAALVAGGAVLVTVGAVYYIRRAVSGSKEDSDQVARHITIAPERSPETLRELAQAVADAGAGGLRLEDAAAIQRDFKRHCKPSARNPGVLVLDAEAFQEVCFRIGLKNRTVVDRLFSVWDEDGNGEIDFSEFLHCIALVRSGTPSEKLEVVFQLMCDSETSIVSMKSMVHFLSSMYRAAGKPRPPSRVIRDVEAIFAALDKDHSQGLSWDEFQHASHTVRVVTGETLVDLLDVITQSFTEALSDAPHDASAADTSLPASGGLTRSKTTA